MSDGVLQVAFSMSGDAAIEIEPCAPRIDLNGAVNIGVGVIQIAFIPPGQTAIAIGFGVVTEPFQPYRIIPSWSRPN